MSAYVPMTRTQANRTEAPRARSPSRGVVGTNGGVPVPACASTVHLGQPRPEDITVAVLRRGTSPAPPSGMRSKLIILTLGVLGCATPGAGPTFDDATSTAMQEGDRQRFAYALEHDRRAGWRNPDTGHEYWVEPTDTTYVQGRECREFRLLADVERPGEVRGTACRRDDGSWEIL